MRAVLLLALMAFVASFATTVTAAELPLSSVSEPDAAFFDMDNAADAGGRSLEQYRYRRGWGWRRRRGYYPYWGGYGSGNQANREPWRGSTGRRGRARSPSALALTHPDRHPP